MTLVRTSPSGPNVDVGGGGGDVSSVFERTGDVEAQTGDYNSLMILNASAVVGPTVADVDNNLQLRIDELDSNDIANASQVTGNNVSEALEGLATDIDQLNTDDIDNVSTAPGATVTNALDALFASVSGRLLGSASRRTAGSETITCPAGTRRILVSMVGAGAGGGGATQTNTPSQTNSAGGGGGAGAEQQFLYTSGSDIASVDVVCGAAGTGQLVTGGDGADTTVTINGETFTSTGGDGGGTGSVTGAPAGFGGQGGLPGENNFQTGSNFVLLRSKGGQPGMPGTGPNGALVLWYGGLGGDSTFGGGGRSTIGSTGTAATGNGAGGAGGSSSAGNNRAGTNGSPGGVFLLFFS